MELGELQGVVEQWLRESLGDPALQVESIRSPEHAPAELAETWRSEKYRGTDDRQLEGVIALDAVIRPAPGDGQWLFYSVIELGYVERITRTVHELLRLCAKAR